MSQLVQAVEVAVIERSDTAVACSVHELGCVVNMVESYQVAELMTQSGKYPIGWNRSAGRSQLVCVQDD